MSSFFAALLAQFFPLLVVKAIHQAAGTAKGDNILLKDGAIIGAVIQVAQPLIVNAAATGKVGNLSGLLTAAVTSAVGGSPQ